MRTTDGIIYSVMVNTPAKVLIIGSDAGNLELLAVVLRHFWEIEKALVPATEPFTVEAELAVLCDTIPEPYRQHWVESLRIEWPNLLIVKLNGYDSGPHASADATVDMVHGPGALVSTIYELLTERGLPSRSWPLVAEPAWIQ